MPGLDFYFEAFLEMLPWRREGHLDLSTVLTWCQLNDIQDPEVIADLVAHLPSMASAYRKYEQEVAQRQSKKTRKTKPVRRRR